MMTPEREKALEQALQQFKAATVARRRAQFVAIKFRGCDRKGGRVTGRTFTDDLVGFVRMRYDAGWRSLQVLDADAVDQEVGGIGPHPDTHKRTWWAASPDAPGQAGRVA